MCSMFNCLLACDAWQVSLNRCALHSVQCACTTPSVLRVLPQAHHTHHRQSLISPWAAVPTHL